MSAVCDELRTLWLPGIHDVSGPQPRQIVGLLAAQEFQIYTPVTPTTADLVFADWGKVVNSFAADSARMSLASFETMENASGNGALPKSAAWLMVRAYYSSFFATHSIMRMLGTSLTNFDSTAVNAVDAVANLYGMNHTNGLQRGLYLCTTDTDKKILSLRKILSDGSHEALWTEFHRIVQKSSSQILLRPGATNRAQQAAAKLIELQSALTNGGSHANGTWLSSIRNRVNYNQAFGAWYPYAERQPYFDHFSTLIDMWTHDPDRISIWPQPGREVQRFVETCVLLTAICKEMSLDMWRRCSKGKSFLEYSTVGLFRRLGISLR